MGALVLGRFDSCGPYQSLDGTTRIIQNKKRGEHSFPNSAWFWSQAKPYNHPYCSCVSYMNTKKWC